MLERMAKGWRRQPSRHPSLASRYILPQLTFCLWAIATRL